LGIQLAWQTRPAQLARNRIDGELGMKMKTFSAAGLVASFLGVSIAATNFSSYSTSAAGADTDGVRVASIGIDPSTGEILEPTCGTCEDPEPANDSGA
jgi:hypothetical protein